MSIDPPDQYTILPTFTDNTIKNIARVYLPMITGMPTLTQALAFVPFIGIGGQNFIVDYSGVQVSVGAGVCFIDSVMIQSFEEVTFSILSGTSYIFYPEDKLNLLDDGEIHLYICGYYKDGVSSAMEIGIVTDSTIFTTNRQYLCCFGVLRANVSSGTITIARQVLIDDETDIGRDQYNPLDGGWVQYIIRS